MVRKGMPSRFGDDVEFVPATQASSACPFRPNWKCPEHFKVVRTASPDDLQVCILCSLQQVSYDIYKLRR